MSNRGHNERSYRLDTLAEEARKGLESVEKGEEFTIGGWLAYGHALNEGRALFPGDREFGQWVNDNVLGHLAQGDVEPKVQQAAMWAAANADQFEEARQRGNPRTIRGIHAKWKEIEAERAQQEWDEQQRQRAEERAETQTATATPEATTPDTTRKPSDNSGADNAGISVAPDAAGGPAEDHEPVLAEKPDAAPDPHAKLRAEFRKLTPDAQEEDWIGLREENADLRKRVEKQRGEIADIKQRAKELSDTNQGATISRLQKQIDAAKYARDEAMAATKRMEYRLKKTEAKLAQLDCEGVTF